MNEVAMDYIIASILVITIVILVWKFISNKKQAVCCKVPGIQTHHLQKGNLPDIARCGSFHEFLLDLHQKYGPIASFWYGPKFTVSIASHKLFKEHAKPFDRPAELFELFKPVFGGACIQYANGTDGRTRHAAYSSCFTADAIKQYYEIFYGLTDELVTRWCHLGSEEHIPVEENLVFLSVTAALQGLLGAYFKDKSNVKMMKEAYDYCWTELENQLAGDLPPPTGERKEKFNLCMNSMYSIVRSAREHRKDNPPSGGNYLYIDAVEDLDIPEKSKMADMVAVLIASFHTTGYALTWAVYFLACNQDVQEKAYKEITDILGEEKVDPETYNDLIYLHQILDETLRCSTLGPYAARYQDCDVTLGGYIIPAGTPVVHALGVAHVDPTVFPEPHKFDPDRFSPENLKRLPAFSYEPFGFAGKRKCPGYRFALTEICVVLCELLKNFKMSLVEGDQVKPVYGLVTKPSREIWITVQKRK